MALTPYFHGYKIMITDFHNQYFFLSNFYLSNFEWQGMSWPSVEHAFQAAKCADHSEFLSIHAAPTPSVAKRLGRQCEMVKTWDCIKVDVMKALVSAKFRHNPKLLVKLLATGDEELVEGNTWNDRIWGKVYDQRTNSWIGENHLGNILMEVRREHGRKDAEDSKDI
jgi:hypothetical protein